MAAHNRLKPYKLANDVHLRFADVVDVVDDELELSIQDAGEDAEGIRQLDLRGARWTGLVLTIEARFAVKSASELVAGGKGSLAETRMIVSIRCPKTKLRRVVQLQQDETDPELWAAEVTLYRRDVRSRLEFHPLFYRTTAIPSAKETPADKAVHRFALLATGQAVSVAIDDVERTLGGPIKIMWTDFGDGKNPWLERYQKTMYWFEYDEVAPVLWLNSKNKNLRAVLFERSDESVDSALRRLMSGWFAETVWAQLFHVALGSLGTDAEEDSASFPEGWRGDVLRRFLSQMFPEQELGVALESVIEARSSPDQLGALMGKASSVIQNVVGSAGLFSDAVRAAEKGTAAEKQGQ